MIKFKLFPSKVFNKIENVTSKIDNVETPEDVDLISAFIFDCISFTNKYEVNEFKKMILYPGFDRFAFNLTYIETDNNNFIIGDQYDDEWKLTFPKSEFLRLLDELAAAIDTGKGIWIEKSDEGKYRIWGE